ncbi:MAG: universal stress protein [Planctomycetes bacterium]|nr:universal stress protein [Planctomycetota bacterium]
MARYGKILVGVDLHQGDRVAADELSPESQAAVNEALEMAAHSGGSVTFCAALNISAQTASLIEQDHKNLLKTVDDVATERLDQIVASVQGRGVTCDRVVRLGSADEELARQAFEGNYDLLVVGTRPRGRTARMLFGSTSQKLIRTATCPVWIVKPEAEREIREIAAAVDLSDSCRPVLTEAVEVARGLGAKLFIVHVVELNDLSTLLMAGVPAADIAIAKAKMIENAQTALQAQLSATDYRTLPYGVMMEVVEGAPDEAIPKFVTDHGIDILILGTHGRSGLTRLLLGNTAERILPLVDCSVIAVKPQDFVSPYA